MPANLLSSIDLFGVPVLINFSGKEKSQSRFGGVCSILFCCFLVWAVYTGCRELFSTDEPKTVKAEIYSNFPRQMMLTPSSFPIAISLQTSQALEYQFISSSTLISVSLVHESIQKVTHPNGTTADVYSSFAIATEKCEPRHFGENYPQYASIDLSQTFCLSQDDISLQGSYVSPIYETMTILVNECDNVTQNYTCASRADLNYYLEGAWFNMIYSNMVIDLGNYERPDSRFQDVYSSMISPTSSKTTGIFLSHLTVKTDSGWLTSDYHTEDYIKLNSVTEASRSRDINDASTPLMACYFEVSKLEDSYSRSYQKVQSVLAEVTGLASTGLAVFLIVTSHFLKIKFRETLMNEIFHINMDEKPPKKKKDMAKKGMTKERGQQPSQKSTTNPDKESPYDQEFHTEGERKDLNIQETEQKEEPQSPKLVKNSTGVFLSKLHSVFSPSNAKKEKVTFTGEINSKNCPSSAILKRAKSKQTKDNKNLIASNHSRAHSWGDQYDTQTNRNSPTNNIQISIPIIEDEKPENPETSERRKTHLFSNKEQAVKLELKVIDDPEIENQNAGTSILMTEPQATEADLRTSERKLGIENNNKLSIVQENSEGKKESCTIQLQDFEQREDQNSSSEEEQEEEEEKSKLSLHLDKESTPVTLSVWEYLSWFVYKPKKLKKKMQIINEGLRNVDMRLDVITILKKMREIDKMRALLFDHDQLILFNNLPKPELTMKNNTALMKQNSFSAQKLLRRANLTEEFGTDQHAASSLERLKNKENKTQIDLKLIEIFEGRLG